MKKGTIVLRNKSMGKVWYLVGVLTAILGCTSGETGSEVSFIDPSPRGYSQSVIHTVDDVSTVFISGQVSVDSTGRIVGAENLEQQTEQVFKNIETQVEKAGGTMDDLVKIDCYFINIADIESFRKARDRYINLERPPASTAVQVAQLISKDFLIEIDAVAIIN